MFLCITGAEPSSYNRACSLPNLNFYYWLHTKEFAYSHLNAVPANIADRASLPILSLPSPPVTAWWPPVLFSVNQNPSSPHSHLRQLQSISVNSRSRYCQAQCLSGVTVESKGQSSQLVCWFDLCGSHGFL